MTTLTDQLQRTLQFNYENGDLITTRLDGPLRASRTDCYLFSETYVYVQHAGNFGRDRASTERRCGKDQTRLERSRMAENEGQHEGE